MPQKISVYGELTETEKEVERLWQSMPAGAISRKMNIPVIQIHKIIKTIKIKQLNNNRIRLGLVKPHQLQPKGESIP